MKSISINQDTGESLELDAGQLIHQITIMKQVPSEDASGPTVIYTPLLMTYAAIEIDRATDVVREGEVTTHTWLRISIWHQEEIYPKMHVRAMGAITSSRVSRTFGT